MNIHFQVKNGLSLNQRNYSCQQQHSKASSQMAGIIISQATRETTANTKYKRPEGIGWNSAGEDEAAELRTGSVWPTASRTRDQRQSQGTVSDR